MSTFKDNHVSTATILEGLVDQICNPTQDGEEPEQAQQTHTQQSDAVDIEALLQDFQKELQYRHITSAATADTDGP